MWQICFKQVWIGQILVRFQWLVYVLGQLPILGDIVIIGLNDRSVCSVFSNGVSLLAMGTILKGVDWIEKDQTLYAGDEDIRSVNIESFG